MDELEKFFTNENTSTKPKEKVEIEKAKDELAESEAVVEKSEIDALIEAIPDAEEVSEEEKLKIELAQKQAVEKVHDMLGDRRIRKPNKAFAKIITVCVILAVIVYALVKIPLFYNCMTPGHVSILKTDNFLLMTGTKQLELNEDGEGTLASAGEEVWAKWDGYFASVNPSVEFAKERIQTNVMFGNVAVETNPDGTEKRKIVDPKHVTIIMYSFDNADGCKKYGASQAELFGGKHEFKDIFLYKLGMSSAKTDKFAYNAWYNGGNFVEVYGTDMELVTSVRTLINYRS